MVLTIEGYSQGLSSSTYSYYRRDHLGNNREVWQAPPSEPVPIYREGWGAAIQRTQYYPSGLPWAEGEGASVQNKKYNGKEFIEAHGLDEYDSQARMYYPAIMRTTTLDPLAEKYYSISPYAWCGNNPVNRFDPDGRDVIITNYNKYNTSTGAFNSTSNKVSLNYVNALKDYMSTKVGLEFVAQFAKKGEIIAGHEFKVDGALSKHTLELGEITAKLPGGIVLDYEGGFSVSFDKKTGKANVQMVVYTNGGETKYQIGETSAHEGQGHGHSIKEWIKNHKAPTSEKDDHTALKNGENEQYNSVKKELEKIPGYKKEFEKENEKHQRIY